LQLVKRVQGASGNAKKPKCQKDKTCTSFHYENRYYSSTLQGADLVELNQTGMNLMLYEMPAIAKGCAFAGSRFLG